MVTGHRPWKLGIEGLCVFETLRRYNSRTLERVKKRGVTANSRYHELLGGGTCSHHTRRHS